MGRPAYIDRAGEFWSYGPDRNGKIGYHVDGGLVFPFAEENVPGMMTFEEAVTEFGLVDISEVTPAHEAYRRLLRPSPAGTGNLVAVDRDDLELILRGWEQWYQSRLDLIKKNR